MTFTVVKRGSAETNGRSRRAHGCVEAGTWASSATSTSDRAAAGSAGFSQSARDPARVSGRPRMFSRRAELRHLREG